ncbi:ABC transporter substrate-binding protein [Pusillimonas sp. CC-YST705]|uniref:ABC transporter substrate-binding protein n=1 Tax=Mesopusillimonas faecipullorum TaxID=2755040 RepID=A0ABS8CC64_9BURK|nr:ABC transporter substrate-binding protein [Mesopusillimonas faecipullorum]MCB5363618.1 ABC transporter substrate-binding protein [Mesopusillimonas faecipullorum]
MFTVLPPSIGRFFTRFIAPLVLGAACAASAHAQQKVDPKAAPDAFVQTVANNALQAIQNEPAASRTDLNRLNQLVDQYVLPYVDLQKTTRLAAARHWRMATPEQQARLVEAFKGTLIRTYSGALAKADEVSNITIQPYRGEADAKDAHVRSSLSQRNAPSVNVDYRLENTPEGWKIYDLNVEGIWLIQNYRNQFNQTISQQGIDGLIDTLNQRNQ